MATYMAVATHSNVRDKLQMVWHMIAVMLFLSAT